MTWPLLDLGNVADGPVSLHRASAGPGVSSSGNSKSKWWLLRLSSSMLNTYRHSSGLGVLVSGPGALVSGPVAWKSVRQRPGSDRQRSVAPGISFDRYSPDL